LVTRCRPTARRLDGAFDLSFHAVGNGDDRTPWKLGIVDVWVDGRSSGHHLARRAGVGHVDAIGRAGLAPAFIATYDAAWVNSEFVRRWTRRYWGVPSGILYPPADVERIASGRSEPK